MSARALTRSARIGLIGLLAAAVAGATATPLDLFTGPVQALAGGLPGWLYAGTTGGGVWRSSDGGLSWSGCNPTGLSPFVQHLAVTGQGTVYVATESGSARSTDQGASWSILNREASLCIGIQESGTGRILIGTQGSGLLMSTDGGASFRPVLQGHPVAQVRDLALHPQRPDRIVLGTQLGIYVSTDGGAGWSASNTGLQHLPVRAMAVDPADPDRLFASTQATDLSVSTEGKIYRSTDGGATWTVVLEELCFPDVTVAEGSRVYAASFYSGVFESDQAGAPGSFVPRNQGREENLESHALLAPGGVVYVGGARGVHAAAVGQGGWSEVNQDLRAARVRSVVSLSPGGQEWLCGGIGSGIWRSQDGGVSWSPSGSGLNPRRQRVNDLAVDPQDSNWVYAALDGTVVYRSSDGGHSWWRPATSGYPLVLDVAVDGSDSRRIYCAIVNLGVFRSNDRAASWQGLNGDIPEPYPSAIRSLTGNPQTILAGMNDFDLYRSTDGGAHYSKVQLVADGWPRTSVRDLLDLPHLGATVLAATTRGLLRSTDGGASFQRVTPDRDNEVFHCLASAPSSPSILYAGSDRGTLLRSADAGVSWNPCTFATGLPARPIWSVAIHPTDPDHVLVGFDGAGLYRVQP